jgi:hypothetical protein
MTEVAPWVVKLTEDVMGKAPFKIGDRVKHWRYNYYVEIVGGKYWGTYGISNFWYWKKVMSDGTLSKKTYNGYGWWPKK